MSEDDVGSSATIINTVEKAEIMSAIGREIERIDRLSASNGYTSWALWAALGVLGWKLIELLGQGAGAEMGELFVFIMVICASLRGFAVVPVGQSRLPAPVYFKAPSIGRAGALRMVLVIAICAACICILVARQHIGVSFWLPAAFFAMPILLYIGFYFAPKIPIAEGMPRKGPAKVGLWFAYLWIGAGVVSAFLLRPESWATVYQPSTSVKAAILLAVMAVLAVRLARNVQVEERREKFQRLETELTLSKVDVQEARDRYENLMLGMNVSVAIRPWIDAVIIPLDEANAGLSEIKQLLHHVAEAGDLKSGDRALEIAVAQRAESLLKVVDERVDVAKKAYTRLKSICLSVFGERDIADSPIASEGRRIEEAQRKVLELVAEVRRLLRDRR